MRLGCIGLVIGVAALLGGGQGTYVALKNRTITDVSIEEFLAEKPGAKWLRITDGQIDFFEAVVNEGFTDYPEFYIPIVSKSASPGDPIHVIYHTNEENYRDLFASISRINDDPDLSDIDKGRQLREECAKVSDGRDFVGLVEFGIDRDRGDKKASEMFDNLAPGAVMLEAGKKPDLLMHVAMLCVGLLVFAIGMKSAKKG